MLRFPNPGSTISNFVAVYRAAYAELNERVVDLDDIVSAVVRANLATSSGYMGDEAISRSTRQDRTRDPLYNQLKMYAELYRALGWLNPTERYLNYTFTLLGSQVVAAHGHYIPLLGETVLGICYPSHILSVTGKYDLRPFSFILQSMLACDECLSRDEMIIGPLSALTDRATDSINQIVRLVRRARRSPVEIASLLGALSKSRGIQINTLKNYTRFPIAIMRDCGWTQKTRIRFTDSRETLEVHKLTTEGRAVAARLENSLDLRIEAVDKLPFPEKAALSIHAHYAMLERCDFDVSSVSDRLDATQEALNSALATLRLESGKPLLFSPFQALRVSDLNRIFPHSTDEAEDRAKDRPALFAETGRDSREHLFVKPHFVASGLAIQTDEEIAALSATLREVRKKFSSDLAAADFFAQSRIGDTQTAFYPLISHLFRILGIESNYSRPGVNYQRWDGWAKIDEISLPIEIKSPTEEQVLSNKAIRQALENKIILLSRGGLKTSKEAPSLIVGFQIPNERGDMATLIEDIFSAFHIRIGVIDLKTLGLMAIRAVSSGETIDRTQLQTLRGFLHV